MIVAGGALVQLGYGMDGNRILEPVLWQHHPVARFHGRTRLRLVGQKRQHRGLKGLASRERIGLAGSPGLRHPALSVV